MWSTCRLDEIAQVVAGGKSGLSGKHFVARGYPAYGAGGLNGLLPTWEHEDGAVILSSIGARCGKCFYPSGKWSSLANTQLIFPDPDLVDRRFLWYLLNDEARWHRSGSAQPYIKPSDVKSHIVALPPLPEQRRIAAILDQAEILRGMRQRSVELLDQIPDVLFERALQESEDWGNPIRLGNAFEVTGGKRLPNGAPYASGPTAHPYLRVVNMKSGSFAINEIKYLTPEIQSKIARYVVESGDLVVSIAGTIGSVAVVPPLLNGANLTENAARLRARSGVVVDPQFMRAQLASRYVQDQIARATGRVTIGKLALFRIENLMIKLPPLRVQAKMARHLEQIDTQRNRLFQHLSVSIEMIESLKIRAFKGEL